jgi:hypothetical protein
MHAIVVASNSRLAHIVLRSLTGIVTGVSVIGEISWWWRIAHRRKFIPLKLDDSGVSVKLLIQAVNRIAAVQAGCVVLPADTIASGMLAAAAPSLHCAIFPSPPRALLDTFNDKWLFHRLCLEHEVPTPKTVLIERKDASSSRGFMQTVQPPIVVKPTSRMAGEGVAVIANLDEYDSQILRNDAYCYSPFIVQQFIPGRDIGISILAIRGEILCSAVQINAGKDIRFLENKHLFAAAERLVKRTEYTGVCHFDAREQSEDGSIWIVEANPRFWGSLEAACWCGLNFTAAGLALALKRPVNEPSSLTEGIYPGLTAALLSILSGRLDRTERGRQQRAFLRNILTDPPGCAIRLQDAIRRFGMRLLSLIRRAGTKVALR